MIHDHQQEYYDAINLSNATGESTAFIEFMLSIIRSSIIDANKMSNEMRDEMRDEKQDKEMLRWMQIEKFLENHENIMNADVRMICDVSVATANRILTRLVADGKLTKCRNGSHWAYQRKKE